MVIKNKLIEILEKNKGSVVSGQKIADTLSVSRTAVWKAVKSLQKDGYIIKTASNSGYKLSLENDVLSSQAIKSFLLDEYKKYDIKIYDKLDSTNNLAKQIIASNKAERETIIIANKQTGGRGRFGRSFFSPANTGIYMSIILTPCLKLSEISIITIVSALAVCKALEKLAECKPQIKWINDIFLNGKKVCGILTETISDFETKTAEAVVVGIGINFKTKKEEFPQELQNTACSVMAEKLSRNKLISEILNNLFELNRNLNDKNIIKEYKKYSFVLNKRIKYIKDKKECYATAVDINNNGNLIVKDDNGTISILESGEISIKI